MGAGVKSAWARRGRGVGAGVKSGVKTCAKLFSRETFVFCDRNNKNEKVQFLNTQTVKRLTFRGVELWWSIGRCPCTPISSKCTYLKRSRGGLCGCGGARA